ncbi:MAG: dihydroorotase [Candidatus Eisenbacteria bacterium]|nr:dihydroorotase [Candidatus Eisenbacteria bacterium]
MAWLIKGARLLDPSHGLDEKGDLLVADGRIRGVGGVIEPEEGMRVVDGKGLVLSPSFIDAHVHLREPGREDAETIASGTAAAAAGGFGVVACMPNTDPPLDDAASIRNVFARASAAGPVRVLPVAAISVGRRGERLSEMGELVRAGAAAFSDDGDPVGDACLMRRALEYARPFGVPVISHSEERALSRGGVMNEGAMSTRLGLRGIPAEAETVAVDRDVRLAELTGGRLHVAHLSAAGSVEIVRRAKERGLAVTAETAPHYLALTEQCLAGYDTNRKMNPPLRTAEDRDALRRGLAEGVIDAIATDHAPHPSHEKEVEFDGAPFGVIGLETALASMITYLVRTGHLDLATLVERFTAGPARVLGIDFPGIAEGAEASLTLFDPEESRVVDASRFRSLSRNTPFAGERLFGAVRAVLIGDRWIEGPDRNGPSSLFPPEGNG